VASQTAYTYRYRIAAKMLLFVAYVMFFSVQMCLKYVFTNVSAHPSYSVLEDGYQTKFRPDARCYKIQSKALLLRLDKRYFNEQVPMLAVTPAEAALAVQFAAYDIKTTDAGAIVCSICCGLPSRRGPPRFTIIS